MDKIPSEADAVAPILAEKLSALADRLIGTGMELSQENQDRLLAFLTILTNYNQKVNLVGNCDPHHLVERHTVDGLTLVSRIRSELSEAKVAGQRLRYLDIGTGGGLPGMIVALCCPDLATTLMDATLKKCTFLQFAIDQLGLAEQIEVVNGRAEEMARESQFRERYKFVTARAVGTLKLTTELAVPFLKPGGIFLAQKTKSRIAAEIKESKDLLINIGAEIEAIEEVENLGKFEELKEALIVPVLKRHTTPNKYPREWKLIAPAK
jgi:16S rRNA (guanine527-N7)-methyltransferase